MLYLRSNLAKSEVHVAEYYMKRGAYLAAANRAQYVIERFQRTSAVEDALEVLIEAYERLGKEQLATDARRVLELNRREGRFIDDTPPPDQISLGRRLWEYLGLDEN
jgi:outer membrane protein assembly factor BamD